MTSRSKLRLALRLLIFSTLCIFAGRAYQYLFFDAPYRVIFWDERLLKPIVEGLFGVPWNDYASNPATADRIETLASVIGYLFVLCIPATLLVSRFRARGARIVLYLGCAMLFLQAVLAYKDKFYHLAQFFEYGIQVGTPLLLLYVCSLQLQYSKMLLWVRLLVAFTFAGHGLYALGVYPLPGHFVDMTITILGVSETTAANFLFVIGVLDLLAAVGVFVPRLARISFLYAALWGTLTALARVVAGFYPDFWQDSLHQNLYQTVYRLPHGILPLIGYLLVTQVRQFTKYQKLTGKTARIQNKSAPPK